jgi:hypothetical protein
MHQSLQWEKWAEAEVRSWNCFSDLGPTIWRRDTETVIDSNIIPERSPRHYPVQFCLFPIPGLLKLIDFIIANRSLSRIEGSKPIATLMISQFCEVFGIRAFHSVMNWL